MARYRCGVSHDASNKEPLGCGIRAVEGCNRLAAYPFCSAHLVSWSLNESLFYSQVARRISQAGLEGVRERQLVGD